MTSAAGTAIGVAIGGRDIPDLASRTAAVLVNTGLISADVAIKNLPPNRPDDGSASIVLTNGGTILGDIDLSGMSSTITNVGGTITGNILLRDDYDSPTERAAAGKRGGDTVDLRGGNFSGNITISAGAAGDVDDQYKIYTGTATTTVNFTGGQSHMTASIRAENGGHVTVAYDMASSGASWSRNADGSVTVSAGGHGTETLMNVEALSFTDRTVAINSTFGMPPSLTTAGVSALHARTLALSDLFTMSDRSGITRYQLWDGTSDPASGHFVVNGNVQAVGTVIDISAAQLAQTSFVTGNAGDSLQIRAFDGVNWSAVDNAGWSPFRVNVLANRSPGLSTYNRLMAAGETQVLSNLFSVSDYENDSMTRYQVWNASRDSDAGYFTINGVRQAAGALIEITAAQLPQTRFVMGAATTSLQIRAFDGLAWSAADNVAWSPFTVSVLPNHAPVLATSDKSAARGTVLALSSLFTVSDADGDSMVRYQLWDANRDPNSGHFVVNGQERAAGQVIELSYSELAQTSFIVGAVSDGLQIRAMDNRSGWSVGENSAWSPFTVSATPNSAPVVTTTDVNAGANQTIALSTLFSVSDSDGDAVTRYQLWDSTRDTNSGHFVVNGVSQAAGTLIDVAAGQLYQVSFQTGTVGDVLQIRAFDGWAWSAADTSSWAPFHINV